MQSMEGGKGTLQNSRRTHLSAKDMIRPTEDEDYDYARARDDMGCENGVASSISRLSSFVELGTPSFCPFFHSVPFPEVIRTVRSAENSF